MALLEVKNVDFGYYGSSFELRDINLSLSDGEMLAIYGCEGSGKTTLMRLLCGLENYSQGSILLDNVELKLLSQKDMNVGYTFDSRILDKKAFVKDVISYPMTLRGVSKERIDCYLDNISKRCDIPLQEQVKNLSELQVAMLILARLFAVDRRLYLIDDVWKDLQKEQKQGVIEYMLESIKGKSVIVATEDSALAKQVTKSKIVVLSDNQVSSEKSLEEIVARPINMQSAIFAGYELHIGTLVKEQSSYYANLYGTRYSVGKPIGEIYVGKEVCFAIKREGGALEIGEVGDGKVMNFYYDLNNERIIVD